MAVSRKRAKLQPELLSPHAAAPAGDLSAILIGRARSRAKAAATPVIEIADHLPSGDRGAAVASESDTHTNDGLLFKKGAATGSSFRPDYWTFDRPDQKTEAPEGPLLAKRGAAPTAHKPQPPPRAKSEPSPKALQEQIEALQALVTPVEPEEEADPAVAPQAPAEPLQAEPPPPASLLEALPPPSTPAVEAFAAAAPPEPHDIVEARQEPAPDAAEVAAPEALAAPAIVPAVEPLLPAAPEHVAEIVVLATPAATAAAEPASDEVLPAETIPVEAAAEVLPAPPLTVETPAVDLIVEPAVHLEPPPDAIPQPEAVADAHLAIPQPSIEVAPEAPVAEAELPPEITPPPIDTAPAEPVIETATAAAVSPEAEAIAEAPVVPEPVVEPAAALAIPLEPTELEAIAAETPAAPEPVVEPAAALAIALESTEPAPIADMAPASPLAVEPSSMPLVDATPPEPTSLPEAVAEAIPTAPEPPRELPTVKVAAARAIELKSPAPQPIVESAPIAETAAPAAPAPLDAAADRQPEPAPVAKAEAPVAAWREGLAELKTLLTELRQRTLEPPAEVPPAPPLHDVPEKTAPEPTPATFHAARTLLDVFPEPEELPPQLRATQDLPPEVPHQMPVVEPPVAEPAKAAAPVAEPAAADDSTRPVAAGYRPPEEVAVADSLGNLIEDVLSRKSFSIATIAARQSRTGAFEPAVESAPSEIESLLSAALEPKPADDPLVAEYARNAEIATPRRRLPLLDRMLAVVTALMLVMGAYFGMELWRNGAYEAMRAKLIALPPTLDQPEAPIWDESPAKQQVAPAASHFPTHRPEAPPAR